MTDTVMGTNGTDIVYTTLRFQTMICEDEHHYLRT